MNRMASEEDFRKELTKLMSTLRNNKAKVPLEILKTRYKEGYNNLCSTLGRSASEYAKFLIFTDIRIHKDYLEEGVRRIMQTISESGILTQLSTDVFQIQDLAAFEDHCRQFREKLLAMLEIFYLEHPGLFITEECLKNPDIKPLPYSAVNGCVRTESGWMPAEAFMKKPDNNTQAIPA